jgi:acetyltransferase-like isoleucine patch superfamily enzyme
VVPQRTRRLGVTDWLLRAWAALSERFARRYYHATIFRHCEGGNGLIVGPDVWRNFHIAFPERLSFGEGTVLNGDCYINAQGRVRIGRYCHIGKGLTIYSSNHNHRSEIAVPYDDRDILRPVEIGDCVWIGANVCMLPGTTVGRGAIVAMGAVVRGNVSECSIVAGNPAKVVGTRDVEVFERLYAEQAFS